MLNEILEDLQQLRRNKTIEHTIVKKINGEEQGEEGVSYEVYESPIPNVFIKLKITTDSYGENEGITGIQFVSPIEKTVTNYEPVK